jgi:hypothetical protein
VLKWLLRRHTSNVSITPNKKKGVRAEKIVNFNTENQKIRRNIVTFSFNIFAVYKYYFLLVCWNYIGNIFPNCNLCSKEGKDALYFTLTPALQYAQQPVYDYGTLQNANQGSDHHQLIVNEFCVCLFSEHGRFNYRYIWTLLLNHIWIILSPKI